MEQNKLSLITETKELNISESVSKLIDSLPEYNGMLEVIASSMPEVNRATSLFQKTQSQFMDNMLTTSHPTPLRNLRQILAEMNKTREALKESHFKIKKKEIEIKMKQRDLQLEEDPLKQELLELEILELKSQLETTSGYVGGAIRKLAAYTEQYNSILSEKKVQDFNEIDFEKEEERYHIMKAFEQATCAARSRSGVIDEGNLIYFTQIGINAGSAQRDLLIYLAEETKILKDGKEPSFDMFLDFLHSMADKYQGSALKYANRKGMKDILSSNSALTKGDTRLLEKKS